MTSMQAFTDGSGLSATWLNHFCIIVTCTVVFAVGAFLVMFLLKDPVFQIISSDTQVERITTLVIIIGIVMVVLTLVGFISSFWT